MLSIISLLKIDKKEWRLVFYLSIAMIIITTFPYLYAYFSSNQDHIYNGLTSLAPVDTYVYLSYLEQVKQGHYLFTNLFTSEQTLPVLNIFWLSVGLIGKIFNLNNLLTFHLVRILLIPICLISIYLLIAYFFANQTSRKIALIFTTISSGTGALASVIFPGYLTFAKQQFWPLDLWSPEANIFLSLFQSPHFIASITLIILLFLFFLLAVDYNKYWYSLLAGLCGLVLIQFHPFYLPTIWLIPFFYILFISIEQRKIYWSGLKHLIIIGILTLPSVLYYLILLNTDWATKQKSWQNICYTPKFYTILTSYGGLLFFAIITISLAIIHYVKKGYPNKIFQSIAGNKILFLAIWTVVPFILIFSPFRFQRRLIESWQIPLVFFGVILITGFYQIIKTNLSKKFLFKFVALSALFALSTFSNWLVLALNINYFSQQDNTFYFNRQQLDSYYWLKNKVKPNEVILSYFPNGNFIPGITGRSVYYGHIRVETLYYDNKLSHTTWFFKDNKGDEVKQRWLRENNIVYVYFSQEEKDLGTFNPDSKYYLTKVYSNNFANIYQVK